MDTNCTQCNITATGHHFEENNCTLIRYDTLQEFNVDRKVERGQLNLAHVM